MDSLETEAEHLLKHPENNHNNPTNTHVPSHGKALSSPSAASPTFFSPNNKTFLNDRIAGNMETHKQPIDSQ